MNKLNNLNTVEDYVAYFYDKPYEFVMWAFPWGAKGSILENRELRKWQKEYLIDLGKMIKRNNFDGINPVDPIEMSVASGHSCGKSSLTAMLILFIMTTRPRCKGTVTANTADQLTTKTWAELSKWYNMFILKDRFVYKNTRGNMIIYHPSNKDNWFCKATTCKEENSEAFAGQHAIDSTSFYIFDESSSISDKIWEVSRGGMVDGEPMTFLFGNPTRNTGFFRDRFRNPNNWTRNLDSRDVEGAINVEITNKWAEEYGEDSDFFKVRVKGEFPSQSSNQFIPTELIHNSVSRHISYEDYNYAPVVLGLDVARYGNDSSCMAKRQGLNLEIVRKWKDIDLMTLASITAQKEAEYRAKAVFIDVGMGAGVIDRLRQIGRSPIEVAFGGKSSNKQYYNKKSFMWGQLKDWLMKGGKLPSNKELIEELIAQEYVFKGDKVLMVSKDDMKVILGRSTDMADSAILTFAEDIVCDNNEDEWLKEIYGYSNKSLVDTNPLSY